jgi:diaminopimelate decarboxylase
VEIQPVTFEVREHNAWLGGLSVSDLAKEFGTPAYLMDVATIRDRCRQFTDALAISYPNSQVIYAGKACLNRPLIALIAEEGLGVDVVSGGELYTVLQTKMPADRIVFHGNNKSVEELIFAIKSGVRIIVDNIQELRKIAKICVEERKKANIMVRLKPEIEAHTHDYIKTGHIESKFGVDAHELEVVFSEIRSDSNLVFWGIHSHIGSQIFDTEPYRDSVDIMVGHIETIQNKYGLSVSELNLGGGFGISYTQLDDPPTIATVISTLTNQLVQTCKSRGVTLPRLMIEPGRSIVGTAGITVYTIGAVKTIPNVRKYLFVDGGMADNIRPMLYQANYTFGISNKMGLPAAQTVSIAGKYCESSDILAHDVHLPEAVPGDFVIVFDTGAYNYSMASNYNRACRPPVIAVENGQAQVWVRRETYADLVRLDG